MIEPAAVELGTNQYQYDSFSPDGSQIAIAWDRGPEERGTYLLDLSDGTREEVGALNNGATFSPDARRLVNSVYVAEKDTDIAVYDRDSGELEIVAADPAYDWLPSYSPDGSKILFNSFRSGGSDIYEYIVADASVVQITTSPRYEAHAQYSPDGSKITYHEVVGPGNFDIRLLDLASGDSAALTNEPTEDSYASWSPDGRYIAFASDRDQEKGKTDIFIMDSSGEVLRKITDHPAKDAYPFWTPNGEYLYFTSYREPQGVYKIRMNDFINCSPA